MLRQVKERAALGARSTGPFPSAETEAEVTVAPFDGGEPWRVPDLVDRMMLLPDGSVVYTPDVDESAEVAPLLWVDREGEAREIDPAVPLTWSGVALFEGDLVFTVEAGDRTGLWRAALPSPASRTRASRRTRAEAMSELRDAGVHFETYERKSYAMLASTLFEPEHVVTLGDNTYTLYENRLANLGKGRGRVRRIAVLTPDGRQIKLLAVSDLSRRPRASIAKKRASSAVKRAPSRPGSGRRRP